MPSPSSPPTATQPSSHADRCRALMAQARVATLSTLARDPAGFPFGSLVTLAVDDEGCALLLLSELAEHTGNLRAHPEASLLVVGVARAQGEPLTEERVTMLGRCMRVEEAGVARARELFLERQPSAAAYVDFADFALYRMEPLALRYVGGFGRMSWVEVASYRSTRHS